MKKRISQVLAIVLTIALLASTFVMLGMPTVSANEAVATEKITIGDRTYTVLSEKKYAAYDSLVASVDGKTPATSGFAEAPIPDFTNTMWSAQGTALWGGGALATPRYISTSGAGPYSKVINFYTGNGGFAQSGIALGNNELYVNPSNSWCGKTEVYDIQLHFTAKEDGKVVLYDTQGAVNSTTGVNTDPYWAWLSGNAGQWARFEIYKNDKLIWPTEDEDNYFEAAGLTVAFPDLGKIEVKQGDVIAVKVEGGSGSRTGIVINPAVAYVYEKPLVEEKTEVVKIGENVYYINANEKYNAASTLTELLKNYDVNTTNDVTSDLDNSIWKVRTNTRYSFNYSAAYTYTKGYNVGNVHTGDYNAIFPLSSWADWNTQHYQHSVSFVNNSLYVNSWHGEASTNTYYPTWEIAFTAPRDGRVLLRDLAGAMTTPEQDLVGYYCWKTENTSVVEVTIWKNNTKIWPLNDTTDNKITAYGDEVDYSDLGAFEVYENDVIAIKISDTNRGQRNTVIATPEIAYIDETPELEAIPMEDKIIGGQLFTVESSTISNAYDAFCALVEGKTAATYTKETDVLSTYDRLSFANTGWAASYKGGGNISSTPVYMNGQLNGGKSYNELYFPSAGSFAPLYNAAIVYDPNEGMVINPGNSWNESKAFSLTYTAPEAGNIVLYDTDGKFTTPLSNAIPYYCWIGSTSYVDVIIYKNGTIVWPLDGEDNRLNKADDTIEFPALELNVSAGDIVSVAFETSSTIQRVPVVADLEVAYTHEHDENVVVTAGTHYIPGKRNGTCTLCGNTYTDAPVINAEPAVTLDENSVKYDPATDKFSFKVYYSEGLMRDYDASVEQELGPTFTLKYKIGEKVKNVTIDPTEYIGHTIEFNGFNSSTLDETLTISFHIAWAGKDDGTGTDTWISYVKKGDGSWLWSDAYEVFTFVPSNYIASDNADLVNSFNTLKNEIAAAESEAAKVVADCPFNSDYRINKAEVNIKEGKAIVSVAVTDELKNRVKENTNAGYDAGRTAKYVLTIGGIEYNVPMDKLYTSTTFTISGLSYSQMFGQISAKIVVTYTDANAQPIESTAITCDFAAAITDASDNAVASALASYMTSK